MANKITEDQYQELIGAMEDLSWWESNAIKIFASFGITVKPYTGYQFYDAAGNYLGDDGSEDIDDILRRAEIEVVEDGK